MVEMLGKILNIEPQRNKIIRIFWSNWNMYLLEANKKRGIKVEIIDW